MVTAKKLLLCLLLVVAVGIFASCGYGQLIKDNVEAVLSPVYTIEVGTIEEKLIEALNNKDIDAFRELFAYSATEQETFLPDTQDIMDYYGGEILSYNVHRPAESSQKRGKRQRTYTDPLIDVESVSSKYVIHLRYERLTTDKQEELGIHSIMIILNGVSDEKSFGTDGYRTLEDEFYD